MIHVHELDVLKLMKIWDSFWCKNPDPYKMTRNRIYVYRLYPLLDICTSLYLVRLNNRSDDIFPGSFDVNIFTNSSYVTKRLSFFLSHPDSSLYPIFGMEEQCLTPHVSKSLEQKRH